MLRFLGDFRGTKDGLKKLIDDTRFHRPLMLDVWQFYRAERLYMLQVNATKAVFDRAIQSTLQHSR